VTVGGGGGTFVTVDQKPLVVASGGDGEAYSTGYITTQFSIPDTVQFCISMSADGNTLVVQNVNINTFVSELSVYTYTDGIWSFNITLVLPFTSLSSPFLKISGDGTTIIYFIPNSPTFTDVLVYQYDTPNSIWITTPITLQNPVNFYRNGKAIDISYDGSSIIRTFVGSDDARGHACVYMDFTWSSPVVLDEPPGNYWNQDTTTAALSGDGLTACVGDEYGGDPIIIYKKTGETWVQDSTLNYHPKRISMSYDGTVVALMFSDHIWITGDVSISYTNPYYIQLSSDGTKLLVARFDNVTIYTGTTPTVLSQTISISDGPSTSMNASGTRIVNAEIVLIDPKTNIYDLGTGGLPGSFIPSGTGVGISGAGYLTDGQVSNPYFGFLKPQAYVDGGFGNQYQYGVQGEGGFGGGQSPLNVLTGLTSVTGYKQIRPSIPNTTTVLGISLSDDGNTLLLSNVEQTYVFQYINSEWVQTSLGYTNKAISLSSDGNIWLLGSDVYRNGFFEITLESYGSGDFFSINYGVHDYLTSISSDGNTVLVCQSIEGGASYGNVYTYSNGSWSSPVTLHVTSIPSYARGNMQCALSHDGTTAVIGIFISSVVTIVNVYKLNGTWSKQTISEDYDAKFIRNLSLSSDGSKLVFSTTEKGYEYSNDVLIALNYSIAETSTFSKTNSSLYVYCSGQRVYSPPISLDVAVEINPQNYLLSFGSSILAVCGTNNNKAIVFVDMYDPTTTCTASTAVENGYPHDYKVQITGTNSFNGTWDIVTTSSDTFTFQALGGPDETLGYVSGTTTGISGGGGYTGSPGDGVSGATCYADPVVRNFTDLGASSNSAGYITVSLLNPVPLKQTWTWDKTFQTNSSNGPFRTLQWSSELNKFLSMSGSSIDGLTWSGSPYVTPETQTLMFVEYSPTLKIYVGILRKPNQLNAFLANSVDGITWNPLFDISSAQTATRGIIWSDELSLFVVLELTKIWYSDNGIDWTMAYTGGGSLIGMEYAASIQTFVVTRYPLPLYSTDGINWSEATSESGTNSWKGVAWSPLLNKFILVSPSPLGPFILYSSDGQTWTNYGIDAPPEIRWSVVVWSDFGIFSVIGPSGYAMYSSDGIHWTLTGVPVKSPESVTYSPSLKFFVCVTGYSFFISIDGKYWVSKNIIGTNVGSWSQELGLFVTNDGFTSNDGGITWIGPLQPTSFRQITWISILGLFIGVSSSHYYYSYDGITWTQSTYDGVVSRIAWSPEKGIIAGTAYSRDGITWVDSFNGSGSTTFSPAWSKELGFFTALSGSQTLVPTNYSYYSYDGMSWIQGNGPTTFYPTSTITWSPLLHLFLCAGGNGIQSCYVYSTNGLDWTIVNFIYINSITWINELSLFIGGGLTGTYTSVDGLNWVKLSTQLICSNMWSPELGRLLAAGGYSDATKTF
jgi:hypothetical protein